MSKFEITFDLRHIRYFMASSIHGSFRKAADALNVQESAISRRIRDLEDQIGASLFIRSSGGVCLTLAGQRFLHRARPAIAQIEEGAREALTIGRGASGHLKIGLFSSIASGFLSRLFSAYDEKYPDIHIDFIESAAKEHSESILKFEIDIAFTIGKLHTHDCDAFHLWSERAFVAIPNSHALSRKEELTWSDLINEKFLVRFGASGDEVCEYMNKRFEMLGHSPDVQQQDVGRYNLLGLVASGRGVALAIQSETIIPAPGIAYRPIVDEVLPFYVIFASKNDNPAARTFLSLARKMARLPASIP